MNSPSIQASNQGECKGREDPLENLSLPLEKCVGCSLKLLGTVQKIWAPLRNFFAPPWCPKLVTGLLTSFTSFCVIAVSFSDQVHKAQF